MFNSGNCASIPLVAEINGGNYNNGYGGYGWGMDGMWAWWLIAMCMFGWGGFGGNGWGGGYNAQQFTQADMQRGFDTQNLLSGQREISNGLCSLGYDQLGQMNQLGNTVQQTGWNLQQTIRDGQVAQMQSDNALSRQFSECCCAEQRAIDQVRFDMSTMNCSTNTNVHQTGDAIINNQNAGFNMLNQTIKDGFCDLARREDQREIAALRQQLSDCNRDNALQGTANYIINKVTPTATPSYWVPNPYTGFYGPYGQQGYCGCGYNNGCNSCCA